MLDPPKWGSGNHFLIALSHGVHLGDPTKTCINATVSAWGVSCPYFFWGEITNEGLEHLLDFSIFCGLKRN